ncbi:ubiquitin carboxyl-terminal hydrolase [Achlya hypogyna]|uniref:Ubiquitin carboxyl-terminal hydrolase n=1 Tax=Achlya hypogyna TaxID=1202772 RepID=A0A1V9Z8X5_ACHHY|nr:ubiquitin carboxyl-terminal hydrolase [Achlya hypogyna]
MSWCTIESDPGVFTSLIEDIGVKGVQVEELYSLDQSEFQQLAPVFGLIFLFKWEPNHRANASAAAAASSYAVHPDLFFAKQVISNACATQAILSILLNLEASSNVEIGDTLKEFKGFVGDFPSDLKGLAISNSDTIRTVHNSFARAEPFIMDDEKPSAKDSDDVYHFVAYVPFQGHVYELDGLTEGPVNLGPIATGGLQGLSWLDVATPVIQQRIEKYASSEIRFNLLALVRNRMQVAQHHIGELLEQDQTPHVAAQLQSWQQCIAAEEQKRANWKHENARRKHNYVPFVIKLLQILAQKGELDPLIKAQLEKAVADGQQQ